MSLKDIIRKMIPILPKRNLLDSITTAQTQLDDFLIPLAEHSANAATTKDYHSAFAKHLEKEFTRFKYTTLRNNFLSATHEMLKQVRENLDLVQKFINQNRQENWSTEALNMRDVTLINYLNALNHVIEYASRMLSMYWVAETNALAGRNQFDGQKQGEIQWLDENLNLFLMEYGAINIPKERLEREVNDISNTVFDPDEEETTKQLLSPKKMDPLGFGFIPLPINPFYIAGRWWVERADARYKALQIDYQRAELRIKAIKESSGGNPSPEAEKMIKALDELRYDIQLKLNKMEK